MRSGAKQHIEEILRDYPHTEKYIKQREEEITYPFTYADTNVGGGRAQYKINEGTAMIAIDIATDKELQFLKYNQHVVKSSLDCADDDTREIIRRLYFSNGRQNINTVADAMNISTSQVSRKRKDFFEAIAKQLGFIV